MGVYLNPGNDGFKEILNSRSMTINMHLRWKAISAKC